MRGEREQVERGDRRVAGDGDELPVVHAERAPADAVIRGGERRRERAEAEEDVYAQSEPAERRVPGRHGPGGGAEVVFPESVVPDVFDELHGAGGLPRGGALSGDGVPRGTRREGGGAGGEDGGYDRAGEGECGAVVAGGFCVLRNEGIKVIYCC